MLLPGKNRHISFILCTVIIFSTIAGALLGAPVVVYALSVGGLKGTIASLIISLLLQTGVAPTNQSWLNTLNSSYGVESSIGTIEDMISNGLLTETAEGLVDSGLSQAIQNESAWTDLGLNEIFETTVNDAGVLAGSGAVNLANQAIHLGTAGTIGAFAGAAAIGVGVGVLANHVREKITSFVKYGLPMSASARAALSNNIPDGYNSVCYLTYDNGSQDYTQYYFMSGDCISVGFPTSNGGINSYLRRKVENTVPCYVQTYTNATGGTPYTLTTGSGPAKASRPALIDMKFDYNASSSSEAEQIIADWRAGNIEKPPVYSPDLVGEEGNLRYDPAEDDIPGIGNIVPDNHDMRPVDMDDYQDYVDQANDNTENDDIDETVQGQDFQDFVNPYFEPIPDEPIIPDDPVTPEQPDLPVKPTPSPEEIQDVLVLTPDENLKDKFPFCIPFDIYDMLRGLSAEREAPVITCPVDNDGNTITVDLSEYDSVAELLRLLELILFIIGLAVATRKLIGATGGG